MRRIPGSDNAYCTPSGKIYLDYGDNLYYPKKFNIVWGYYYVGISYNGKVLSKRVHRLIAQTYIENPQSLPVVGHKNNIKTDNRVENLYWTTIQENTLKALADGLAKNDKGWEDSQSMPVCQFDLNGNLTGLFGSVSEASRETGMTKTGILYQCLHKIKTVPRKKRYYRFKSEYDERGFVL